jgi:serine protease Do
VIGKKPVWIAAVSAVVLAVVLVVGVALAKRSESARAHPAEFQVENTPVPAAVQDTIAGSRRNAIVLASQRVAPSVVSVNVVVRETVRARSVFDDLFFGGPTSRDVPGLGSGFIIREDGIVLTNEHVVRGANQIVVTLPDGRDFAADVAGLDPRTDLAVLRLRNASKLPVAALGTSSNLIIGEWAIAIGNPFGFSLSNAEPSVTAGVISGVGRNIIPSDRDENAGLYLDMIQTDASINPGNSGGPLVNALGQVIGVNSSILSQTGGSIGLGFAIPIDRARRVAADILAEGKVRRAYLGATVVATEPNAFGRSHRVRIDAVAPESPAARAGLRAGDEVVRVSNRPVFTPLDWEGRLLDARIGQAFEIVVSRGGSQTSVRVTPTDVPSLSAERVSALSDHFQLISVTAAIRSERRLRSERGALVVNLTNQARSVGFRENDVLVEVNGVAVRNAEEAARVLQLAYSRGGVQAVVERQGEYVIVSFR